jgi:hypothetical protein
VIGIRSRTAIRLGLDVNDAGRAQAVLSRQRARDQAKGGCRILPRETPGSRE